MRPLKIIFAGTPEFASVALDALLASRHAVVAVYTQPDRPAGRGRKLRASAVKQLATAHQIPVFQPTSLKPAEVQAQLKQHTADVMVVAAYGLLLPRLVLDIPRFGCLNIHASLLPRWRGAAPIQRAILAGDKQTGITIMQMDEGLDTGDILLQVECPITTTTTAGELHDELARLGADALLTTLDRLGELHATPQDDSQVSYAAKLDKSESRLDWSRTAPALNNQIRAFNPWPVAQTRLDGQTVRVWSARPIEPSPNQPGHNAPAGTIVEVGADGITTACGQGRLLLTRIQLAGGKPMPVDAVLNGHPDMFTPGRVFD